MRQRVAAFRDRASALRGRLAALGARVRPSERRANQLWKALIVFAFVLPIVATGFEIFRQGYWPAGILFAIIIVVWVAVMWWGWRQGYSDKPELASATPDVPGAPTLHQPAPNDGRTTKKQPTGRK